MPYIGRLPVDFNICVSPINSLHIFYRYFIEIVIKAKPSPRTRKINVSAISDVVKPLQSSEISENHYRYHSLSLNSENIYCVTLNVVKLF